MVSLGGDIVTVAYHARRPENRPPRNGVRDIIVVDIEVFSLERGDTNGDVEQVLFFQEGISLR